MTTVHPLTARYCYAPRVTPDSGERIWHLSAVPIFDLLSPSELAQLERQALIRAFQRKDVIYFPSEPGETVYIVLNGRVKTVYIVLNGRVKLKDITPEGKESILGFVEAGELFGELALFDDEPRQNFAEAMIATTIAVVPRQALQEVMSRRADLSLRITKLMGFRRRQVEARLRQLLFRSTRDRLILVLLSLYEQYGSCPASAAELALSLSHQDLAGLIGATRESVTMALGELQGQQLIRVKRQKIILLDIDQLRCSVRP